MSGADASQGYGWANRILVWALVVGLLLPLAGAHVSIPCAILRATGAPCFSCGLTRSVAALYRGELSLSVSYHPAGIVFVVLGVAELAARWALQRWLARNRRIPWLDLAQIVVAVLVFHAAVRWGAPLRQVG